jgi:hypothetical protein
MIPMLHEVNGRVVEDHRRRGDKHQRDGLMDQVLADADDADVRRAPEQPLAKHLVDPFGRRLQL